MGSCLSGDAVYLVIIFELAGVSDLLPIQMVKEKLAYEISQLFPYLISYF